MSESTPYADIQEGDELVIVFQGDLAHCRERLTMLVEEGIPGQISASQSAMAVEGIAPVLQLEIRRSDLQDVAEIFAEVWQEALEIEGFNQQQIQRLEQEQIDFSQDTIICPGCQAEISEVTEDGECIECGLFLGLPEDMVDEE